MVDLDILSEVTIHEGQGVKRVRQYVHGSYPKLGKLHEGWSGHETIIEKDQIKPLSSVRITPTLRRGSERFGKSLAGTIAEKEQGLWQ